MKRFGFALLAVAGLLLTQFVVFWHNMMSAGVYLDEWIYFGRMHFCSKNLLDLIWLLLCDPRITVRPLEAFHFPVIYFFVQERPFVYHLTNYIFESISAILVLVFAQQLFKSHRLAYLTALLYLLWPTHDATHFSIVTSSITIAASFLILSFILFAKALTQKNRGYIFWSSAAWLSSLAHYEFALPLICVFPCLYLAFASEYKLRSAILTLIPNAMMTGAFVLYRVKILPLLGLGWNYQTRFDFQKSTNVILEGVKQNLAPNSWEFLLSTIPTHLLPHVPLGIICAKLLVIASINAVVCWKLSNTTIRSKRFYCLLVLITIILIPISYVPYALSPDHLPTLTTSLNRVNMGSAICMPFLLISLSALFMRYWSNKATQIATTSGLVLIATSFGAICQAYAQPWLFSWQVQKQIHAMLLANKSIVDRADAILLTDVARWYHWAPIYDGPWDFQNTIRILFDRSNLNGTTFTERLHPTDQDLEDKFNDITLTRLPYAKMLVVQPARHKITSIKTRTEFSDFAKQNHLFIPLK